MRDGVVINIRGYEVTVSPCDVERIKSHNWNLAFTKKDSESPYFAYTTKRPEHKSILLHRFITNCPDGKCVDHVNGNTLDNRRSNLRVCEQSENRCNSRMGSKNTSGYKGVSWSEGRKKWRSQIKKNRKIIHLGYFYTPEKAYEAYVAASQKYHGEFGRIT